MAEPQESYYLELDTIPIVLLGVFGMFFACLQTVVYCNCCCSCNNWIGKKSTALMYGDGFGLIKSQSVDSTAPPEMYIGNRLITPEHKLIRCMLAISSICLLTLLAMTFADIYFVKTFPDCNPEFDCYPDDDNFT